MVAQDYEQDVSRQTGCNDLPDYDRFRLDVPEYHPRDSCKRMATSPPYDYHKNLSQDSESSSSQRIFHLATLSSSHSREEVVSKSISNNLEANSNIAHPSIKRGSLHQNESYAQGIKVFQQDQQQDLNNTSTMMRNEISTFAFVFPSILYPQIHTSLCYFLFSFPFSFL